MESSSIIYYTSNREGENFEKRVRDNVLAVTDLPIISVSQKPIDFGQNICVGDVGVSGFNMFRQVQIACLAAQTRFVISVEADCLYPPEYFQFTPERDDLCYRDSNVYVMPQWRDFFFKKPEGATHAQVVNREYYLETLEELFRGSPKWNSQEKNFPKERWGREDVFKKERIEYFETENPVVQIKTTRSMRHYTNSDRVPTYELPYWGDGKSFRKRFYADN